MKVRKRAPFKSEVCVGKDGLWKLLRGFQEVYGKAIQVGVIGEFQFNTLYVLPLKCQGFIHVIHVNSVLGWCSVKGLFRH